MPPNEADPDQRVRATSSRRQTTDDNQCSGSFDRATYTQPANNYRRLAIPRGRTSSSRSLWYRELLALREFGKTLTDDRLLRGCGRRLPRGNVGDADQILEITVYCGRAWLCPLCGYRIARDQFRKLDKTLAAWTSQGGAVAFLTLTQSHSTEDELDILWDRLEDGWDATVRGSGWRADRKSFGLRGYVRVTEVVHHSDHGWNVHYHVLLLLDKKLDEQQLCNLRDRLTARFLSGIRAAGGQATLGAQRLAANQPGSEYRIARYCAKGTTVYRTGDSRSPISRSPMVILADLKETGDGLGLWKEFGAAVTGKRRRRYSPSQGIAKLVRTGHHLRPGSVGRETIS